MSSERPEDARIISEATGKFNRLTLLYAGYSEAQILGFGDLSTISDERMDDLTLKKAAEYFSRSMAERMDRGELKFQKLH